MTRKIRCIIIDDEPLARQLISAYVEKTPLLILEGCYESGADAIKRVMSGEIDIVFLDINMPMLNGIEFAEVIPETTRIIYITAYEQYALQGYRVNALDYLLKPVSFAEFTRAVGKAAEWVEVKDTLKGNISPTGISPVSESDRMTQSVSGGFTTTGRSTITLRSEARLIRLHTDTILYIEVRNDRVIFYRKDGDPVSSLISLKEIEELLPSETFMRVHRSFIVNIDNIEIVERNRIVIGKTYIPIADSRRDEFLTRFMN